MEEDLVFRSPVDPTFRPKVSAIVSVYKAERYLQGCLEDLLAQSLFQQGDLEVVVVDSNSPEKEGDLARPFLERHPQQVQYLRTRDRETIYGAWNRGVRAARGRYVSNANADDRHSPDGLERLAQALDAHPEIALVYGDDDVTRVENGTFATAPRVARFAWPAFEPRHLFEICHIGPHPMWRKELHERHGWFDPGFRSAGDYDFWLRLAAAGERFLHLETIVGLYLQSPEGVEIGNQELSGAESHLARVRNWPKAWGRRPDPRGHYLFPLEPAPEAKSQVELDLEQLVQACKNHPLEPAPYAALGLYFGSIGLPDRGLALVQQALTTFPESVDLRRTLEHLQARGTGGPA